MGSQNPYAKPHYNARKHGDQPSESSLSAERMMISPSGRIKCRANCAQHTVTPSDFMEAVDNTRKKPMALACSKEECQTPITYNRESQDMKIESSMADLSNIWSNTGVYIGVQEEEDHQVDTEDNALKDTG